MGNSASFNNANRPRIANSLVGGGSSKHGLGLSKQELDERCRPSGLYKSCQWDDKVLRRMIGDGKLASRKSHSGAPWECPICFCNYEEVNKTMCCEKEICTECFLQLKPQKNTNASCPFCVDQRLKVQRCLEAPPETRPPSTAALLEETAQKDSTLLGHPSTPPSSSGTSRSAYCLTPEQRQMLEAKVAEQQIHPLAARLAQEEAERRLANELNYLTNNPTPVSLYRRTSGRRGTTTTTTTTTTMTLTEEQQLAMAIEASLRTGSS